MWCAPLLLLGKNQLILRSKHVSFDFDCGLLQWGCNVDLHLKSVPLLNIRHYRPKHKQNKLVLWRKKTLYSCNIFQLFTVYLPVFPYFLLPHFSSLSFVTGFRKGIPLWRKNFKLRDWWKLSKLCECGETCQNSSKLQVAENGAILFRAIWHNKINWKYEVLFFSLYTVYSQINHMLNLLGLYQLIQRDFPGSVRQPYQPGIPKCCENENSIFPF